MVFYPPQPVSLKKKSWLLDGIQENISWLSRSGWYHEKDTQKERKKAMFWADSAFET